MSEYMEKFSVSRLLGAPPGYVGYEEGGYLTEKVRRRPYSVVLFDEIEKAHPDVFNMLLQVLDDGRLTDSVGHVVDFKNTILIMTSNLGTSLIGKRTSPGFLAEGDEQSYEKMKDRVMEEMKRAFRPEFLNRIDDIIVFHALSERAHQEHRSADDHAHQQAADREGHRARAHARRRENSLVEKGYDPTYGARQLRRTIQKHIEDPLAEAIVRGQLVDSARIEVDVEGGTFVFREAQPRRRCPSRAGRALNRHAHGLDGLGDGGRAGMRAFVILWSLPCSWRRRARPVRPSRPHQARRARPILIRELAVQGNRRVQEAVILGRVRSMVGVPFNPSQASDDIRAIFTPRVLRRRPAQGRGLRGRRQADLRGDGAAVRARHRVHREQEARHRRRCRRRSI